MCLVDFFGMTNVEFYIYKKPKKFIFLLKLKDIFVIIIAVVLSVVQLTLGSRLRSQPLWPGGCPSSGHLIGKVNKDLCLSATFTADQNLINNYNTCME